MRPNLWVWIPSFIAGAIGGFLGWLVTDVSCRPSGCTGLATLVGILAFLAAFIGVMVVAVLVVRSLNEWRSAERDPDVTSSD